ncbi:hypothetical protein JIN84_03940 [Luteolibacter yonseiensis]|uniref:Type II secretion system protein GspG C-terminal domain-containing protein n=1 Tax=Luteolibacter yonseiensis TaxID=1144680 RepID=A0A934R3R4_9BACT|nr:hypothetical protein [Luteolibacter yonseiensis]MBK1814750.1 hypothetical protein [Luteolibacter yonseiensis]
MKPSATGLVAIVWLAAVSHAAAGMTVVTLTDVARARIDALSFFLFTYLVIAWVVKLIWNQLAKTFTSLPRLKYLQALGVVFITGLLFYVVLTMISGARELLTPGAWEKQGTGYRMREGGPALPDKEARREALREIQSVIWSYAKSHEGNAPASPFVKDIDPALWSFQGGGLYCLMPDVKPGVGRDVLIYEPSSAGARRFVLLADGSIEDRPEGTLKTQLNEQLKR